MEVQKKKAKARQRFCHIKEDKKGRFLLPMNSISQTARKVNDFSAWQEKKAANIKMARRMGAAGFKRRAFLMEHCGDYIMFGKCEQCGNVEVQHANLCRDRLCPVCQWRLSRRLFSEMCRTLCYINDLDTYTAGFLTLTVKNCAVENLSSTLSKMAEAWNRMLASRQLKGFVAGWAKSVEITYNAKTGEFHPHYHVIILYADLLGEGRTRALLNNLWKRAYKAAYQPITDFRIITEIAGDDANMGAAIAETYKYAVKHDACENMPLNVFREFVKQINGKRFQSYGGIIKRARASLGLTEDENAEEEGANVCQRCGGELQQYIAEWSFTHSQYQFILKARDEVS